MAVIQMPIDPLVRSQHSRRHLRSRQRRSAAPARVLVVADDPAIHLTVGRAFAPAGVHALPEVDVASTFSTEAEARADLIVAESHKISWEDLRAGLGHGTERTRPVVVVFGDNDEPELIDRLLEAGVACCLSKSLPAELFERELRLTAGLAARRRDTTEIPRRRHEESLSGDPGFWPFSGEN